MLLIMGIAISAIGIGFGIYSAFFSSSIASAAYTIPAWFANLIAITFIFLGIALFVLGAYELDLHYFGGENSAP